MWDSKEKGLGTGQMTELTICDWGSLLVVGYDSVR